MITMNYLSLTPAYGRDYKSAREVTQAFLDGKDFEIASMFGSFGGRYCSVRDFAQGVTVSIRYNRLTRVVNVKVPANAGQKESARTHTAQVLQQQADGA